MRSKLALLLLGVLFGASASAQAAATEAPTVTLSVLDCEGISADEVRRIASIELKLAVTAPRAARSDATDITIHCDGISAELALVDGVTEKSLQRSVDLQATAPLARPRLLALSVTELISASWAELELERAEQQQRRATPDVRQARDVVRARRPPVLEGDAQLLGGVRVWSSSWFSYGTTLRLQLGRPLNERWALLLASSLAYERGARTEAAGAVELTLLDAELALLIEARLGAARLAAGAGLRGGLLRASGRPSDPTRVAGHTVQDGYFGSVLQIRGTFAPGSPLRASVGLEAGIAARAVNVRVLGEPSAAAGNSWIALTLGAGLGL